MAAATIFGGPDRTTRRMIRSSWPPGASFTRPCRSCPATSARSSSCFGIRGSRRRKRPSCWLVIAAPSSGAAQARTSLHGALRGWLPDGEEQA